MDDPKQYSNKSFRSQFSQPLETFTMTAMDNPVAFAGASELNQHGAALLASGDYRGAYCTFQTARRKLRSSSSSSTSFAKSQYSSLMARTLPRLEDDNFYMFNQALLFHADGSPSIQMCDCILNFNLALSCHGQALVTPRDQLFSRALTLYRATFESLSQLPDDYSNSEYALVLTMGALNNLSHIHFEFGEVSYAARLLQTIQPLTYSLSHNSTKIFNVQGYQLNTNACNCIVTARCA